MVYKYKDFIYVHDYGKGKLYKGNHLLYKGNTWTGIGEFLKHTENIQRNYKCLKIKLINVKNTKGETSKSN